MTFEMPDSMVDRGPDWWDLPTMIVVADSKKRVTLPTRPGASFELQAFGEDKFVLVRQVPVTPRPARIKLVKVKGRTVAKTSHPVSPQALQKALAEFP